MTNLLKVVAQIYSNILIYFAAKMCVAFAMQMLLTFFQQKISMYLPLFQDGNLNITLANKFLNDWVLIIPWLLSHSSR